MSECIIVPFRAVHLKVMEIQEQQAYLAGPIADGDWTPLESDNAATLLDEEMRPVACCGVMPRWEGVGYLWTFLSRHLAGPNFVAFHRLARDFLARLDFDRIEAGVEDGFEAGERWAAMMGFSKETRVPMRKFMYGRDFHLWAKVR